MKMRPLTREQMSTTVTAAVASSLSLMGSLYILMRYWYVRCMKARAAKSRRRGGVRRVDVTQELIHVLAWLDLLGALGRGFGSLPTVTFDQTKGEKATAVCKLQAFAISFSDVSAITWNFLMAFNLFRWVCLGEDQQRLQKTIKWYVLIALASATTVTGLAIGEGIYGDAHVWCWIAIPDNRNRELYWKLGSLYIWILVLALAMGALLIMVKMNVRRRLEGLDNKDARIAYRGVVQTLTIYIVAFIICWVPPFINRVYTYSVGRRSFTLEMLHALIVSLQGFVNAVIYGKLHVWMARHLVARDRYEQWMWKSHKSSLFSPRMLQTGSRNEQLDSGIASIFLTTFDMNWSDFPTNLDRWIPRDKDIYVFTLHHCVNVQQVEHTIREYLLRVNFPMGYRSITSLAGSVSKGSGDDAQMCQMVFVNNSDVASGNFQFQTADGRQWAQRRTNKNIIGIPIRYFDASIAFVACNLRPTIGQAPNQSVPAIPLTAKHAATSNLIRSLTMGVDRSVVDFPHLYHHTFLAGDLNYGISKRQSQLISAIDQAYRAECLKRASDSASQVRLNANRETLRRLTLGVSSTPRVMKEANSRYPAPRGRAQSNRAAPRDSVSSDSTDTDEIYEILYSDSAEGLAFTEVISPRPNPKPAGDRGETGSDVKIDVGEATEASSETGTRSTWLSFLDNLFPSPTASPQGLRFQTVESQNSDSVDSLPSPQDRSKQLSGWLRRSQFAAHSSHTSWKELLRHDELRNGIQAREILCGFEEPPISFLPSFPRKVGVAASYSMSSNKTCSDFFGDYREGQPAYADRILAHSLPDTRERVRNIDYWLCEDIATSTHKPVCSLYELEVDRFFAYKNNEASETDAHAGNMALRDKTDVREFKIKLTNLDANMWTYQPTHRQSINPLRKLRSPSVDAPHVSPTLECSASPEETTHLSLGGRSPETAAVNTSRRSLSTRFLESRSRSSFRRSRRESQEITQLELVPIEPSYVRTVFPLPSEDVFALQRKVHEVAHSVQTGFLSSSHSGDAEEASLAFTNSRTVTWREATAHGVTHSAIAKPVNGVLHIAISVQGTAKDQGGQGILCIKESDLINYDPDDTDSLAFDIPLTWGGKHVGYLHGDIIRGL